MANEYGSKGLSFTTLRDANLKRVGHFKNARGETVHRMPDGSDWTPAQWLQSVCGELGEYANLRKKFERGDMGEAEFRKLAAGELADIQTYLDLLAYHVGVDLGQATADKFNQVSERVKSPVRIDAGSDTCLVVSLRRVNCGKGLFTAEHGDLINLVCQDCGKDLSPHY